MYFTIPENCLHTEAGGGSRPLFCPVDELFGLKKKVSHRFL